MSTGSARTSTDAVATITVVADPPIEVHAPPVEIPWGLIGGAVVIAAFAAALWKRLGWFGVTVCLLLLGAIGVIVGKVVV